MTRSRRLNIACLVLLLAAAISFRLASSTTVGRGAVTLIMLIAAFKAILVALEFMEVRTAQAPVRIFIFLWISAITAVFVGLHFMAGA